MIENNMKNNDVKIFTKEEKTHEFLKKENIYKKFYNYKGIKALRIFLKLSKEKGENSYNLYEDLKKDFPTWNFMKVLSYEKIKNSPFSVKTLVCSENVDKTFSGKFVEYSKYLINENDKQKFFEAIDLWYKFEYTFLQKNYFHTDFNLNNFMIDPKTKNIVFIDFDDIKKEPHFKKKLLLTQSIRSFDATLKDILLSMTNMKISDKKEILDKFKSVVSHYDIKMRPKDIEHEKRVLNEK